MNVLYLSLLHFVSAFIGDRHYYGKTSFEEPRIQYGGEAYIDSFPFIKEVEATDMSVRGNTEFWNCSCHRARDHTIVGIHIHEQIKEVRESNLESVYENDIGIITVLEEFRGLFETGIPYTNTSAFWHSNRKGTQALGWGHTKAGDVIQKQLQTTSIHINTKPDCVNLQGKHINNMSGVYCASYVPNGGSGPCTFDEGGPLVAFNSLSLYSPVYTFIGVTIRATSCEYRGSLFANVTYYETWITNFISGDSNPNSWYI